MIRFSPSNVRDPDGRRTPRDACAGEHCYCVKDDCLLATIPAGSTEELRDVETNLITVITGLSTSGLILFGDVDNPHVLNEGVRASFSISASSFSVSLNADGATANDSDSLSFGGNPRITSAVLCIDQDGKVTAHGTAEDDTGSAAVYAELTGYNLANNRNYAGISGTDYSETKVYAIESDQRPECDPCPPPPAELTICTVCGPLSSDKPANLRLTFSGWGGGDPDSPCHPDSVCTQLNGTYTLPNRGPVEPCCYELRFDIPTNSCQWISDCPDGITWIVRGFCLRACLVENTAIPPDMYRLQVEVSAYGFEAGNPGNTFDCFLEHCNENFQWRYLWDDFTWFDPLVNPCNNIDHTIPNGPLDDGTLYWFDNQIQPKRCTDFTPSLTPVRVEAA